MVVTSFPIPESRVAGALGRELTSRPHPGRAWPAASQVGKAPRGAAPSRGAEVPLKASASSALQGKQGAGHPSSHPFPDPCPGQAWVTPAKTSRTDRARPAGQAIPEPRLPHRLHSPHLRAQLGWKLLQLPQGRPLFRLHPSTEQKPRSHDTARSRLRAAAHPRDSLGWAGRGVETLEPLCACAEAQPKVPFSPGVKANLQILGAVWNFVQSSIELSLHSVESQLIKITVF